MLLELQRPRQVDAIADYVSRQSQCFETVFLPKACPLPTFEGLAVGSAIVGVLPLEMEMRTLFMVIGSAGRSRFDPRCGFAWLAEVIIA